MKNILLVYGHALSHCALRELIKADQNLQLVDELGNAHDAITRIRQQGVDVVILDVSTPETNGLEAFCDLRQAFPHLPILITNGSECIDRMLNFVRLGCAGYLSYTTGSAQVIPAINAIAGGQRFLLPQHQQIVTQSVRMLHECLSMRELQVFFKLIKGQAVNAIALELAIAPGSVSVFRAKILKKMHLQNNAALIHYALKHQLTAVVEMNRQPGINLA